MFIVAARYLFLCDEDFTILENQAFVFEDKIFYTQININGDTWELVETKTLYSENGDLETAEPIE